ncbi:hypothetical protein KGQ71_01720 [Patescibacteria group bacterium]|nr:hypothetical protein [Patescibacteria group bacterium]
MAQAVAVRGGGAGKVKPRQDVSRQPLTLTPSVSPDQLKKAVAVEADRREIIKEFVRSQLEAEKDYGRIDVRTRTGQVTQSKPVLFKSGMEKIFSLFNVVSTLVKDNETVEMVNKPGVIAYKCILTRNGQFIGEGRGACDIAEKGRINDAIKIAEKRARMDACLNLGFSEYFTQDLDDTAASEGEETAQTTTPTGGWKNGEVRETTFTVKEKEIKNAQTGTVYALLYTDIGVLKAWKNTYDQIEVGQTYRAMVEASEWNGTVSLSISSLLK